MLNLPCQAASGATKEGPAGGIERDGSRQHVAGHTVRAHALGMFVVTDADAAAIRAVFRESGEFAAAVELRRRFPGITDNAQAQECARTIAGWRPLRPVKRLPKVPRLRRVR